MQRHSRKRLTLEQAFAQVLKDARLKRGLSQEKLAFEAGYHRTYIGMLERGLMNPSLETILSIAMTLGIPAAELVHSTQDMLGPSWRREPRERGK